MRLAGLGWVEHIPRSESWISPVMSDCVSSWDSINNVIGEHWERQHHNIVKQFWFTLHYHLEQGRNHCDLIVWCWWQHARHEEGFMSREASELISLTTSFYPGQDSRHKNWINDHIYSIVKERYSNIWPNQTIVSDHSELIILLCQPMHSLLLMKTTLPWYSGLQLLPSYIYDPWTGSTLSSLESGGW